MPPSRFGIMSSVRQSDNVFLRAFEAWVEQFLIPTLGPADDRRKNLNIRTPSRIKYRPLKRRGPYGVGPLCDGTAARLLTTLPSPEPDSAIVRMGTIAAIDLGGIAEFGRAQQFGGGVAGKELVQLG